MGRWGCSEVMRLRLGCCQEDDKAKHFAYVRRWGQLVTVIVRLEMRGYEMTRLYWVEHSKHVSIDESMSALVPPKGSLQRVGTHASY